MPIRAQIDCAEPGPVQTFRVNQAEHEKVRGDVDLLDGFVMVLADPINRFAFGILVAPQADVLNDVGHLSL